jgi:hypothetical protein
VVAVVVVFAVVFVVVFVVVAVVVFDVVVVDVGFDDVLVENVGKVFDNFTQTIIMEKIYEEMRSIYE